MNHVTGMHPGTNHYFTIVVLGSETTVDRAFAEDRAFEAKERADELAQSGNTAFVMHQVRGNSEAHEIYRAGAINEVVVEDVVYAVLSEREGGFTIRSAPDGEDYGGFTIDNGIVSSLGYHTRTTTPSAETLRRVADRFARGRR